MTEAGLRLPTALPRNARVRVLLVGAGLPIALILLAWWVTASLTGLPGELPSHWGADGADALLPPAAIRRSWLVGAAVVAALTISVCVGSLHGGWHPLGKGAIAVGIGLVGGVLSGLLAQMLAVRGNTTEQLVDGGVPLYLFVGPGRGLVAGPGMADFPCHE